MVLTANKGLYYWPKPKTLWLNGFPIVPLLHTDPKRISYFFFRFFYPVNGLYSSDHINYSATSSSLSYFRTYYRFFQHSSKTHSFNLPASKTSYFHICILDVHVYQTSSNNSYLLNRGDVANNLLKALKNHLHSRLFSFI